ncbi:MAG: hypothetical protein ACRDM1_05240, partial [Gaiellaceae bacterium]
ALGFANRHEVRLARMPMFFSWGKAQRELGYEPGPVDAALAQAVQEALALEVGQLAPRYATSRLESRRAARPSNAPAMPSRR